jgi:hypothetical protein
MNIEPSPTYTIPRCRPSITVMASPKTKLICAKQCCCGVWMQGKVDHVGSFPELEDEMCTWEPLSGMPSPDRLDALVWALTDLAIGGGPLVYTQAEEHFVCDPMRIPSIWQRVYAIDFDNSYFAAVWGAHDRAGHRESAPA